MKSRRHLSEAKRVWKWGEEIGLRTTNTNASAKKDFIFDAVLATTGETAESGPNLVVMDEAV